LATLKVDVIVVSTTSGLSAVVRETQTIPIVFVNVADPVGSGFISGLARPGGSITGFANFEPSMAGNWIKILTEIAPNTKRVLGVFRQEAIPNIAYLRAAGPAARLRALEFIGNPIRLSEINAVIGAFAEKPNGELMVYPEGYAAEQRRSIIDLAASYKLPTVYPLHPDGYARRVRKVLRY
jgi:putative ABC transport system substrate-binding protein